MATASPSETVLSLARARPATLGPGRLVCVDGPAGSGKTTLGRAVAAEVGAQLIGTDELMDGWRGLGAVERQLVALCASLAAGRPGSYERYDWHAGEYAERVPVTPAPWLVVEGVGSGAAALAACTTVLVWVEADDDLRLARVLARDGAGVEAELRRFVVDERELFAREGTRARADLLVDGTVG